MNILAVDTAGKTVGVALMQDDRLLYECYLDAGMTHSETLMPLIDGCLKLCGMGCKDIDLFGVNAGPGSFTGLRIGLAAVKGLAFPHRRGHRALRTGRPPRAGVQRRFRPCHPSAADGRRRPRRS